MAVSMARRFVAASALVLQVLVPWQLARAARIPVTDLDLEVDSADRQRPAVSKPRGPALAQISDEGHFESLGKDTSCHADATDKNLDGHGTALEEPAGTLEECKDLCLTYEENACQGFAYNAAVGMCHVWPRAIGSALAMEGFECFRRTDAGVPERDEPDSPIHWATQSEGEEKCVGEGCVDGDEVLDPDQTEQASLLESNASVRKFVAKKWPGNVLKYSWDPDIAPEAKEASEQAFLEWEAKTCVTFEEAPAGKGVVAIQSKKEGCWAHVGYSKRWHHTVNLGEGCWSVGTAIHELGHALGMGHEHQRADAAEFIEVVLGNVKSDMENQFSVKKEGEVLFEDVPYDLGSIMHYGSHYFAKTRDNSDETKTIRVKKKDKLGNCQVGQRSFLSSGDILTINRWYGCPGRFCADLNKNCRKFKKKGYCERDYDKWMKANCPHSCGVCECKDEDEDKCPKAAEKGYCVRGDTGSDSNKKWMAAHCPKSCGRCSHDDKSLCKDQHIWGKADGCQRYKDRLYKGKKMCTSRHFRGKCPKTCNLCPHKAYCW